LLCADFDFGADQAVPLVAFAQEPMDVRSACIAVIRPCEPDVAADVASYRQLGAPVVVALRPGEVEFWRQGEQDAELIESVSAEKAEAYFRNHRKELSPEAVFRAKTWGRLDRQFQLTFVDAGLMPLVEEEIGRRLTDLIGRVYQDLRRAIWPRTTNVSAEDGRWLVKASFWLLAAKILRDKRVPNFITLDLSDVENVFARVARHYDSRHAGRAGVEIRSGKQRHALEGAADEIARFSHLGHVTTESLSHVYESALITPSVRKELGTHSTPQYLVDYVVWKLSKWIDRIPVDDRHVFEPACGHGAFLVASMRLLKELLGEDRRADRKRYLRAHLHGVDIDSFAIEIARLSLTLADIPNSNGWDLQCRDMFKESTLGNGARRATILLGNPPFENFSTQVRRAYAAEGSPVAHVNKTAEVLAQVLPQLAPGGVFGFVVPQGILHGKGATDLRALICRDFEIEELCLFPDKVFAFSDAESAIILGRRLESPSPSHNVSFRRVREDGMDRFRLDYEVTTRQSVLQSRLCESPSCSMRLPDLVEVWDAVKGLPRLESSADIGKGFEFRGRDLSSGAVTLAEGTPGNVPGFVWFDAETICDLPTEHWIRLDSNVIRRPGTGVQTGTPQVLVNYARVSRGPWRLKALVDAQGHPVTSRFITVRPVSSTVPLGYLWAVLNNPLANAYVYCHSMKRDILVGLLRGLPIPVVSNEDMARIAGLAVAWIDEIRGIHAHGARRSNSGTMRRRLLLIDAEVLRLYGLAPRQERELLDLFAGHQRVGVPFTFDRYFPEDFEPWLHLHEYLSEEFSNSRALALLRSHRTFDAPEVSEALRRATEDFEE